MATATAGIAYNDDGYWIELGEDDSGLEDFKTPLLWDAPNGKKYIACMDSPDESAFEQWLYEVKPLIGVEPVCEESDDEESDEDDEDVDAGVLLPDDSEVTVDDE